MNEAFVYCWTDHSNEKLYVGIHKGAPTDGYVCSSKVMLREYKERPNDFSRQIVAEGTWLDCVSLERAILESVNAAKNPDYYNQHNSNGFVSEFTPEIREKIGKTKRGNKDNVGRWKSRETRQLISKNRKGKCVGVDNPMHGKTHTPEAKLKISEAAKKRTGENNPMFGKKRADVSKRNVQKSKGTHWYNNGIYSKQYFPNEVPVGWNKGRLPQKNRPKKYKRRIT